MIRYFLAAATLLLVSACATPGPVKVVQRLSVPERIHVAAIDIKLAEPVAKQIPEFDEKAAGKRRAAVLRPIAESTTRPTAEEYETIPTVQMFTLVIEDALARRGLNSANLNGGRPVKLVVQVDTLKTANAAMAWLAGSSDQLAGLVQVHDATSGEKLSEFYVDVLESHSGLLAMAMRGGGVREKLADKFANHIANELSMPGTKHRAL